uniref:Uncharacterized protein n=1 Tax=Bactrocera dorsalis TaxID=27457 RepID=A0A034W858_BACDO
MSWVKKITVSGCRLCNCSVENIGSPTNSYGLTKNNTAMTKKSTMTQTGHQNWADSADWSDNDSWAKSGNDGWSYDAWVGSSDAHQGGEDDEHFVKVEHFCV